MCVCVFLFLQNLYLKKALCEYASENTNEFYETICVFTEAKVIGAPWQIHTGFPVTPGILYTPYIQFNEKQFFKVSIKSV